MKTLKNRLANQLRGLCMPQKQERMSVIKDLPFAPYEGTN